MSVTILRHWLRVDQKPLLTWGITEPNTAPPAQAVVAMCTLLASLLLEWDHMGQ